MSLRALEIGSERREEIARNTMRAARGRREPVNEKADEVLEARTEQRPERSEPVTTIVPRAWPSST